MLLTAENLKVGLVPEHVPVKDITHYITRKNITRKFQIINASFKQVF